MTFELKTISKSDLQSFWDTFDGEKTFLQGTKFGDFREKLGERNLHFGIFEEEKIVGIAQCQKICARRGIFLHIPHGPLSNSKKAYSFFLEEIKKVGKTEQCDFIRVSPLVLENTENASEFSKQGFRTAPLHINPDRTWILDLTQNEEDILKNMRKSTRYEINRIGKTGITLKQGHTPKDLDIFWQLHLETVSRQGFTPFAKKATETELEIFGEDCQIFGAKIDNKFYSSSIILFDKNAGYYHQGSSIYSKSPVAHATLWAAIKEAKQRGCKEFNFWGVSPEENTKHPWTGLSRFKRGFGGEEKKFLSAQDFPLTKKYWLNFMIESYRKWKRNY
jgi:lipid II:glycine glycyltransferase (peptidoglycan interpeptide bridge formation enzyme)